MHPYLNQYLDRSQLVLVAAGAACVFLLSLILWVRKLRFFHGFRHHIADIRKMARFLHGRIERKGSDLQIIGKYRGAKVQIDLSDRDDAPACMIAIQCASPAKFVVTTDERIKGFADRFPFKDRFLVYVFDHGPGKKFFASDGREILEKILISREWSVRVRRGTIRLAMLRIPDDLYLQCTRNIPLLFGASQKLQRPKKAGTWQKRGLSLAFAAAMLAAICFIAAKLAI
jgi:hypothetical protein